MSTVLPFASNNITIYAFEPFSYTISNPNVDAYTLSINKSSGIPASYLVNNGDQEVIFATTSNGMTIGTQSFTVSALDGSNVVATSSNSVTIAAGRFVDSNSNSITGSSFVFYAKEAIPPIQLVAPFSLSFATSTPSLPPGLSFSAVSGSNISIVGTPFTTSPQSNYLLVGKQAGGGKTVSSTISVVISNERIITNISPSDIVSGMTVGTPIVPRVITAIGNGVIRYTWNPFPTGIYATDVCGSIVSSGFEPINDPSNTLVITGAPTLDAANIFKNAGVSNITQSIGVTRMSPAPQITNTIPVTYGFAETVLFDPVTIPSLYTGVALDPSAISFYAATYFSSNVGMSNIFSPDLRSDLSLSFVPSASRSYLVGTPTSAGTGNYTIRAVNSNGTTRDLTATITVSNDTVTFVPPTPASSNVYTFVVSRPVDLSLAGYYPTPITFAATAASGRPIVWSAPALSGTGIALDVSGNRATLGGTPTTLSALQTLGVRADATGTPATATQNVQFEVINDVITLSPLTTTQTSLIQNKAIPPIQLSATSLSGRPVVSYSATGLPSGLVISSTGRITGAPTVDGSFTATLVASTGFVSSSTPVTFTVLEDKIIVVMSNTFETVPIVFSGVGFRALTYSGTEGTLTTSLLTQAPYQGSNFSTSFVSGTELQGNFSIAPALLPEYRFRVTGTAGNYTTAAEVNAVTSNAPTISRLTMGLDSLVGIPSLGVARILRSTTTPYTFTGSTGLGYSTNSLTWSDVTFSPSTDAQLLSNIPYGVHDIATSGSVAVATAGQYLFRSTDAGATWSNVPSSNIQAIDASGGPPLPPSYAPPHPLFGCIATDGASNWLTIAIGTGIGGTGTPSNILRTSSDNGATWVDSSTNLFVSVNQKTKLFYNNGRYFVLQGASATNPLLYAEASNVSSWTAPAGLSGSIFNDFTSSNNTLLVVGSNTSGPAASRCFSSSNNGTTWTVLPSDPYTYSGGAEINAATYAHGIWTVSGRDTVGFAAIGTSTDLVTWSPPLGAPPAGTIRASCEDGGAWQFVGTTATAGKWEANGLFALQPVTATGFVFSTKRIVSETIPNGTPTLTMSIPYDPSDIAFVSPTQTSYVNWQFVPISPITVQATPNQFLYYYASGLPDGLSFTNDVSGLYATISGTSVRYSDAPQRVLLYVALGSNVAAQSFTMRTILPTVTKQQSSAGGVTSLLRQYTEVNAAVTARDNKALPAIDYRLGEFTAPEPPSVITAVNNCSSNC